jgi:hypothetical protein
VSYQVFATAEHRPESAHLAKLAEELLPLQPAGEVHAVEPGHSTTVCGVPTDGLFAFPMHVWETITIDDGACPRCTAAIAAPR